MASLSFLLSVHAVRPYIDKVHGLTHLKITVLSLHRTLRSNARGANKLPSHAFSSLTTEGFCLSFCLFSSESLQAN